MVNLTHNFSIAEFELCAIGLVYLQEAWAEPPAVFRSDCNLWTRPNNNDSDWASFEASWIWFSITDRNLLFRDAIRVVYNKHVMAWRTQQMYIICDNFIILKKFV